MSKTFEDLGLRFDFDNSCVTCKDGSCHAMVTSKKNGNEYSVHISTDEEMNEFEIYASQSSSTFSGLEIHETFTEEDKAVDFLCSTFQNFKCF